MKKQRGWIDWFSVFIILFMVGFVIILILAVNSNADADEEMRIECLERGFNSGKRLGAGYGTRGFYACLDENGQIYVVGDEARFRNGRPSDYIFPKKPE